MPAPRHGIVDRYCMRCSAPEGRCRHPQPAEGIYCPACGGLDLGCSERTDVTCHDLPTQYEAWTDGSGTVATKYAGCGAVLLEGDRVLRELSVPIGLGTNNRAELCAIGIALRALWSMPNVDTEATVTVYTDSEYCIGALTQDHIQRANEAVIGKLRGMLSGRRVRFRHVHGHQKRDGIPVFPHNDRADALAGAARLSQFTNGADGDGSVAKQRRAASGHPADEKDGEACSQRQRARDRPGVPLGVTVRNRC